MISQSLGVKGYRVSPAPVTCVVLAAGTSARMGFDKLSAALSDGTTLLERTLRACAAYPRVLVISTHNLRREHASTGIAIVLNDEPHRGMTHSLRLADRSIDASHTIAVLPADLRSIDPQTIARVAHAHRDVDIAYPVRDDGTPGHPVFFSPRARAALRDLPEGDTLRLLRDRPDFSRATVVITGDAPFVDIDTPADFYDR